VASGDLQLTRAFTLGGLVPRQVPAKASFQIMAELPDGSVQPLLWLVNYKPEFRHPFILRKDLELPARTVIRGIRPVRASLCCRMCRNRQRHRGGSRRSHELTLGACYLPFALPLGAGAA